MSCSGRWYHLRSAFLQHSAHSVGWQVDPRKNLQEVVIR